MNPADATFTRPPREGSRPACRAIRLGREAGVLMRTLAGYSLLPPGAPPKSMNGRWPLTVRNVLLLGQVVTAGIDLDFAEHRRRQAADLGAVTDPVLLDRLLSLPCGVTVADPGAWAEMRTQPPGIIQLSADGPEVTRLLRSPLTITDVTVDTNTRRELKAVQSASWFAAFNRRWIRLDGQQLPEAARLEATLCGVGVVDPYDDVILPAADPVKTTVDKWTWLNEEKTYRRWLDAPDTETTRSDGAEYREEMNCHEQVERLRTGNP